MHGANPLIKLHQSSTGCQSKSLRVSIKSQRLRKPIDLICRICIILHILKKMKTYHSISPNPSGISILVSGSTIFRQMSFHGLPQSATCSTRSAAEGAIWAMIHSVPSHIKKWKAGRVTPCPRRSQKRTKAKVGNPKD